MEKDIEKIIAAELSGEITDGDKKKLDNWLDESKVNHLIYHQIKKYWDKRIPEIDYIKAGEIKDRLWNTTVKNHQKKFEVGYFIKIAAVLLVFFLAVFFVLQGNQEEPVEVVMAPVEIVKSNPRGVKTIIKLPDGSKAQLNSESKIWYNETFSDSIREVSLEGEAFFEIIEEADRPFIVKAGDISTYVLGTSFNVRAFPDENVQVSLSSGKVIVSQNEQNQNKKFELSPGQFIHFNEDQIKQGTFDKDRILGWRDGIIIFDESNFNTIIKKLERWYGVEFVYAGEKPNWRFNGKFVNESLDNILEILSHSQKFNYAIDDKKVKLKF